MQVFEETGSPMAYSEPDALNAITQFKGRVSDEELDKITCNSIKFLCKPVQRKVINSYVLKPTQPTMITFPHIVKLFPHSFQMFIYRHGLDNCKSGARGSRRSALLTILLLIGRISPTLTKYMVSQMGLPTKYLRQRVLSKIHFISVLWASGIRQYLDYRESGMDIVGIRYEDIVQDTKYAFESIFQHCGLPFDGKEVEKAMGRDSQRGTPVSAEILKKYKMDMFTEDVKKQTDMVCNSFNVPHIDEEYVAPGTVTYRSQK